MLTATQYASLKTELQNDPAALGYAALLSAGDYIDLARVLDFIRNGTTACPVNSIVGTAITVWRNNIQFWEIINSIAAADFTSQTLMTTFLFNQLDLLQNLPSIDATQANIRSIFNTSTGIFAAFSAATKNALTTMAQRNGSRAEQLFGTGTVLTDADVQIALGVQTGSAFNPFGGG